MRNKRVLVLVHEQLVPPENVNENELDRLSCEWITEYDVIKALKEAGHDVHVLGIYNDLQVVEELIEGFKPHVVFNLLEEFNGETLFDQNIVSYLEMNKIAYTGCNPKGLMIARHKDLAKKLLLYHEIDTPLFWTFKYGKRISIPADITYPLIVKCLYEEASLGITQSSIVKSQDKLIAQIELIHEKYQTDVIVEQFIEGHEYSMGVYGNKNLTTLPLWHVSFSNSENPEKEIYSLSAKWNKDYRCRKGIKTERANLDEAFEKKISEIAKYAYRTLELSGYARIDMRIDKNDTVWIIEANPNPNIAIDDEFALSAKESGIEYTELINKIISLGI